MYPSWVALSIASAASVLFLFLFGKKTQVFELSDSVGSDHSNGMMGGRLVGEEDSECLAERVLSRLTRGCTDEGGENDRERGGGV